MKRLVLSTLLILLFLLTACATADSPATGSQATATPGSKPATSQPTVQATPTSPPPVQKTPVAPTPQPTTPPQENKMLSITLDKTAYTQQDTIVATVQNQSGTPVFVRARFTNCTILRLERQQGDSWQVFDPCSMARSPQLTSLKAGSSLQLTFRPVLHHPVAVNVDGWPTGTYRFRLGYQSSFDPDAIATDNELVSQTFKVT